MRFIAGGALIVVILGGCSGGPADGGRTKIAAAPEIPGPLAPEFEAVDLDGRRVDLDSYRGRPIIINFWATWCLPCQREMPSLVDLHRKLSPAGLAILAVSIDADAAVVRRYLEANPLPLRVLLDPARAAADRYGVVTIPSSFVLDPEGHVAERIDGEADWTNPELLMTLERLVKRARPTGERGPADAI